MAVKKKGRRIPSNDWSWVGAEIKTPNQITIQHRRRAAGLVGGLQCPYRLEPQSGDLSDDSITLTKDPSCTERKCKEWYRCYNHLGVEQLVESVAKEGFVQEKLGLRPESRDGPSGLRNLGATCYANAFLQLWFHNIAFRNGVYGCVTSETTPLFHLSLVFASLQYSDRKVVDPTGLIKALRLEQGNQQDAAEFSKLFISLIASEFRKQPDPGIKSLVKDQFEGTLQYVTRCNTCAYESKTTSTFLELELSLKNATTLDDCLNRLTTPESLDGDNQYNCPACRSLRPATRSTRILSFPPVIHFSLLRFVFDQATMSRKKSKMSISYPKTLHLQGGEYELRGVVTHQGASAHHGHFVCEVYDEENREWYNCNDEEVLRKLEPPRKKLKVDATVRGTTEASKDAYMLVYKRTGRILPLQPPPEIVARVEAENAMFGVELDNRALRREVLLEDFDHIRGAKMDVLRVLPGLDHVVPREALSQWIKCETFDDLFRPFDCSPITCTHGGFDPDKSHQVRTISHNSFDKLHQYTTIPDLQVCPVCVEEGFARHLAANELTDAVGEFDKLMNSGEECIMPHDWVASWRKGTLPPETLPTDDAYSLFCHHDKPWKGKRISVSLDAVTLLWTIMGNFPVFGPNEPECDECRAAAEDSEEARQQWSEAIGRQKRIRQQLDVKPAPFGIDHYVLPSRFHQKWATWLKRPGPKPDLEMDLCNHGLIDFDPMLESVHFLTEAGWEMLCDNFGKQEPIVVQFGSNPLPGKRTTVTSVYPPVCEVCRRSRLADFESATIHVVLAADSTPPIGASITRRSTRSKAKQIDIEVRKTSSIKDIKVEICGLWGISPICQRLYHHERELESTDTIADLVVLAGDTLRCIELEEKDDMDDVNPAGEGFGGTALVSPIPCTACTFLNPGGAYTCEICGSAL